MGRETSLVRTLSGVSGAYGASKASLVLDPKNGHQRFNPMPTQDVLKTYFTNDFQRAKPVAAEIYTPDVSNVLKTLADNLRKKGLPEKFRFHEVGCGYGAAVWAVQQMALKATGNEVSPTCVEFANKHCAGKIRAGSFEATASSLSETDLFFVVHALERIIDPQAALKLMAKKLSKKGFAYICVANGASHRAARSGIENCPYFGFPGFLHYFTPASLCQMIAEADMEPVVIETRPMGELPDAPGEINVGQRCERLLGGQLFVLAKRA